MTIEPKVWTKSEIIGVIATEFRLTREDCQRRGVPFSPQEAAEAIYAVLDDNFMIQLEP